MSETSEFPVAAKLNESFAGPAAANGASFVIGKREILGLLLPGECRQNISSFLLHPRHSCESRNPGVAITKSFCNGQRLWIPAFAGMTGLFGNTNTRREHP